MSTAQYLDQVGLSPEIRIDLDGLFGPPSAAVTTVDDIWIFEIPEGTADALTAVIRAAEAAGFHVDHLRWDGPECVGSVTLIDDPPPPAVRRRWWHRWQITRGGAQ
ncbi:MAG: hypothetical protein WCP28_14180 [Actinomycetes bacterium]